MNDDDALLDEVVAELKTRGTYMANVPMHRTDVIEAVRSAGRQARARLGEGWSIRTGVSAETPHNPGHVNVWVTVAASGTEPDSGWYWYCDACDVGGNVATKTAATRAFANHRAEQVAAAGYEEIGGECDSGRVVAPGRVDWDATPEPVDMDTMRAALQKVAVALRLDG